MQTRRLAPPAVLSVFALTALTMPYAAASAAGDPQGVRYVDAKAAGSDSGGSWTDAYIHLQDALAEALRFPGVVSEIRVAQGVYTPDAGAYVAAGDRYASFELVDGVRLLGGYAGVTAPGPDLRDPRIHETVLSGRIDEREFGPTTNPCLVPHDAPGCGDWRCEVVVCWFLSKCCEAPWDQECVDTAASVCSVSDVPAFEPDVRHSSLHVVLAIEAGAGTVLDGFTIEGGNADASDVAVGGGMDIRGGDPTVSNCAFIGNTAARAGGGMYIRDGSPTVSSCVFDGNSAAGSGGGMYIRDSSPTASNCVFVGNTAAGSGGAMYIRDGSPTISNCVFVRNAVADPSARSGTSADGRRLCYPDGGAIHVNSGAPRLESCILSGNSSYGGAGGFGGINTGAVLTNCVFNGNTALQYGGGAFVIGGETARTTFLNCTFSQNSAQTVGGLYAHRTDVVDSILWGNTSEWVSGTYAQVSESVVRAMRHSCIEGSWEELPGVGNIDVNPLFVDPLGPDGVAGTLDDDLRLAAESPCINRGDPAAEFAPDAVDLAGNPRLQSCRVDMGAYESDRIQPIGDFDDSASIDLADAASLQMCFGAADLDLSLRAACLCSFDFDDDGDVSIADYAAWMAIVTGPRPE